MQSLPYKGSFELATTAIHFYFILVAILDIAWIFVWPLQPCLSLILMIALWFTTAKIYVRIACVEEQAQEVEETGGETEPLLSTTSQAEPPPEIGRTAYVLTQIPFSLLFSWVTVGTFVNLFSAVATIDVNDPFKTIPFAMAAIILMGLLALSFLILEKDVIYSLAIIWGLIGIGQGRAVREFPGNNAELIARTSFVTAAVVFAGALATVVVKCARFFA